MESICYKVETATAAAPAACSAVLAIGLGAACPTYDVPIEDVYNQQSVARCYSMSDAEASYSYTLSAAARIKETLASLRNRYCDRNWNGYGEASLSVAAWNFANAFVQKLPTWVSEAEVCVDADGDVSLEWYRSKTDYLVLLFSESGFVHCFMQTRNSKCSDLFKGNADNKLISYIAEFEHV